MTSAASVAFLLALAAPSPTQGTIDGFEARMYRDGKGAMPYRLFIPTGYDEQRRYPLVVWLHGAGGIGNDNISQVVRDQLAGTHTWTTPDAQTKCPAFVLAPQSDRSWVAAQDELREGNPATPLALVLAILDRVKGEFRIDPQRVYVAGQSIGGDGVWDLIANRPELFAAALVICGGGSPERAARVAKIPIWVFHGSADRQYHVIRAREMIAAIVNAGGCPRYTEYKDAGHEIWKQAFDTPGLVEWLFAQHSP